MSEEWTPDTDWLALIQAQEIIVQQRPWWNPFGIDWNIRASGPDWSLSDRTERHVDETTDKDSKEATH